MRRQQQGLHFSLVHGRIEESPIAQTCDLVIIRRSHHLVGAKCSAGGAWADSRPRLRPHSDLPSVQRRDGGNSSVKPHRKVRRTWASGRPEEKRHRIRVDISSSNFPRFDVNPNTGEPLNNNRRSAIAVNTIYDDAEHPSQILLPVIPK
jgi:hypothetical protein